MPEEIAKIIVEGESRRVDEVIEDLTTLERQAQSTSRAVDDLNARMSNIGARPSGGERYGLYRQLQEQGLSEEDIRSYMGASSYNEANTAADQLRRAFDEEQRKFSTKFSESFTPEGFAKRSVTGTETVVSGGQKLTMTSTSEIENEARAFSDASKEAQQYQRAVSQMSSAQFEASLKGKSLEEQLDLTKQRLQQTGQATTEYYQLQGRQAGLESRIDVGQQRTEAKEFDDAARAADQAANAQQRLSEATFQSSLKGKDLSTQYQMVTDRLQQTGQATLEYQRLLGQQSSLQARIDAQPIAGSLESLRNRATEARNNFILGDPASTKELADATSAYDKALKGANDTMGKTKSFADQLGETFQRQIVRIGIGVAVWYTLRTAQREIQQTIDSMESYSIAVARFAAVTDQSIGSAIQQYNALRDAAVQSGYNPTQASAGIIEASRFQKTPEGQQELYGAAANLSEALGLQDTKQATNALGEAMLATGRSANEMADLIAAGYKRVGGDASQFMSILPSIQTLSGEIGMSFDKTFSIIVGGAAASGQQMSTVYQALNRFSDNIDKLQGDKIVQFASGFRALGIDVLNSNNELKGTGDILAEVGSKWDSFTTEQRNKIITLLGGESIKGQIKNAGVGLGQALADGFGAGLDNVQGTVNRMTAMIDNSFGQIVNRIKARTESMRQGGNVAGAGLSDITSGANVFLGSLFGGARGGQIAAFRSEIDTMVEQMGSGKLGETSAFSAQKKNIIDSLVGVSPEDKQRIINEYNQLVEDAFGSINYTGFGGRAGYADALKITDADTARIVDASKNTGILAGQSFIKGFLGATPMSNVLQGIINQVKSASAEASKAQSEPSTSPRTRNAAPGTPAGDFQTLTRNFLGQQTEGGMPKFSALSAVLPTNEYDLTKYSEEQINQAKQLSIQLSMQEIALVRERAIAMGLTAEEADKIAESLKKELDTTTLLLQTTKGLSYETGAQVANLQKAIGQIQNQQKQEPSNFQFQRLKDVSPDQFPQLQALAQMYNNFLSQIGSPEKNQNINLLMGEQNVFKTLNVRMTALQLALEDLTKVEKAQLAGTWNLPAGATALVPIQSLDIQRWNKSGGGGGLSPEAIQNLLNAMPAINEQSTTPIVGAVGDSASRIVAAILSGNMSLRDGLKASADPMTIAQMIQQAIRDGLLSDKEMANVSTSPWKPDTVGGLLPALSELEKLGLPKNDNTTPAPQLSVANEISELSNAITQLSSINQQVQSMNSQSSASGNGRDMEYYRSLLRESDQYPGQFKSSDASFRQQQTVNVTISALPLKANFNANLSVILNGQIVAKTIFPILYQMMMKMSNTAPTAGGGLGALR